MKMHRIALALAVLLVGCETINRDDLAELNYGIRPTGWRKQVTEYLQPKVPDGNMAQISFRTEPKTYVQRETVLRDRHWGWAVCVHVFENHPEGAEEPYPVVFFFRGESLVFVNGGPGDKNPVGAGYARNQCADLGAAPIPVKL